MIVMNNNNEINESACSEGGDLGIGLQHRMQLDVSLNFITNDEESNNNDI